jgi:hypothetical protein
MCSLQNFERIIYFCKIERKNILKKTIAREDAAGRDRTAPPPARTARRAPQPLRQPASLPCGARTRHATTPLLPVPPFSPLPSANTPSRRGGPLHLSRAAASCRSPLVASSARGQRARAPDLTGAAASPWSPCGLQVAGAAAAALWRYGGTSPQYSPI